MSDQGYTPDPDHGTWDPEDASDLEVAGPDHDGSGGLNLQPEPDASPMVAPRIKDDQGTPLYDRGIDDMDTVGLVEKAGEDTGRRERANEFMASLAPALRGMILTGPIATLEAGGRDQWAPLLEQLDQMDGNRGEDTDAEEAVAKELARVFLDEGGDAASPSTVGTAGMSSVRSTTMATATAAHSSRITPTGSTTVRARATTSGPRTTP